MAKKSDKNTFSIIGLVCSLVFFIPFCPLLGIIFGIVGLVKGESRGIAITAIAIGAFFIILGFVFLGLMFGFIARMAHV